MPKVRCKNGEKMTSFSSMRPPLENRLIGNVLKEYPQMGDVMKRHFGGHRLERPGFKIQTLGMACILSGIDQKQLFQDFEKIEHG
jgi:hypothetical protein